MLLNRYTETPQIVLPENTATSYGIEVELENNATNIRSPYWTPTREGSINGTEYISNIFFAQDALKVLSSLKGALLASNRNWTYSIRCSTHVHCGIGHLDEKEYVNLLLLLTALLPSLYKICNRMQEDYNYRNTSAVILPREFNQFALPNYLCFDWFVYIGDMIYRIQDASFSPFTGNIGKYAAINAYGIKQFGTIEIRIFPILELSSSYAKYIFFLDKVFDCVRKTTNGVVYTMADIKRKVGECKEHLLYQEYALPNDGADEELFIYEMYEEIL